MFLAPYMVKKPWGGFFISERFGIYPRVELGEAFLVSTLENAESLVNGTPLSKYLENQLPFLIKVIDACDNLSVQVHPDDYWSEILEKSVGKSECWFVLEAEAEAGVYVGFRPGFDFRTMERIAKTKMLLIV